jgi:phage terminase large subunit-like protein
MAVSRRSNTHHKAFDRHRAALLQQQMLGLEADDIARILSQLQGKPEPEPVPDEKDWDVEDLKLLERGLSVELLQARRDFASFCRYLDPELEPAAHHQQWHKYLITEQSNKYLYRIAGEKLSILSPRGSSKSTVLGLFLAWAIGIHAERSRALQILYISANREIALAKSETIRNLLTTEKYQQVFPFVQPNSKKWANTVWSIDRKAAGIETTGQEEFSMIAAGVLGTIVSKRCHLTAFDDLIKNPDDISNPAVREKMIRTINAAVRPTLLPGGRQLSVGTRFTGNDIHVTDFIPEKGWDLLEQSALVLPGELGAFYPAGQKRVDEQVLPPEQELVSYWESMWSTEYLKQLEAEDRISFGYQFQNKISAVRGEGIDPNDIQYGLPPHDFDYLCIGCDLAVSKRQAADYTVFTLVGKRGNEYWVLDFWRGKETGNLPKINRLIELYENWADETGEFVIPWRIAVEKVAYQASLCDDLTRELYQKHSLHNIVVLPHRMKGDKRAHIQSVTGVFANKLVFFNEMVDWGYFVSELTGSTRHDDCADSLIIALQSLGVRRKLAAIDASSFGAGEEEEEMNQSLWGNWY